MQAGLQMSCCNRMWPAGIVRGDSPCMLLLAVICHLKTLSTSLPELSGLLCGTTRQKCGLVGTYPVPHVLMEDRACCSLVQSRCLKLSLAALVLSLKKLANPIPRDFRSARKGSVGDGQKKFRGEVDRRCIGTFRNMHPRQRALCEQ